MAATTHFKSSSFFVSHCTIICALIGVVYIGLEQRINFKSLNHFTLWAVYLSRYSDWLRAGWSGDRIPVGARFSASVQPGPGAHPASCTMGTGSFPGVKSGRGVTLIPHPLLVLLSRRSRAILLLPLWTVRPVDSLSVCTRVKKLKHSRYRSGVAQRVPRS